MTYAQISDIIAGTGIPYAYYQFPDKTEQEPPFICFFYPERNDFIADNSNYSKITALAIELKKKKKDFEAENTVEQALEDAGLVYRKEETYIDSERLYEVIYTCEVIING